MHVLWVSKLAIRNTILANLGNPDPKINQKASNTNKKQLPPAADPPVARELFFTDFVSLLIHFWSKVTQSR